MKLQGRVLLLVTAILVFIGVVSGGMVLYFQRRSSIDQFEHMARALAGAVQGSLEQSMFSNEQEHVREAMVRIRSEEMVNNVVLYSADGVIVASTPPLNVGATTDVSEVRGALQTGETFTRTEEQNRESKLLVTTPILNEPECQGCHRAETAILGAIEIGLNTSLLDQHTRQQTLFIGISGGLTFLILGGAIAFTLRRAVLNPLSGLTESARRLSRGDYTTRAKSDKDDEIGILAQAFNEMAGSVEQRTRELEGSQQELASLNMSLEDRVQQRTRELQEANKLREQLLEKLISAQEEERRRIARELHDEATQSLAALAINLESIADSLPQRYQGTREKLDVLKEQAIKTLGGIRSLALELRPSALDDLGLSMAVDWYAKDYLGKRGLDVKINAVGGKTKLPAHTETMLFRIVQEALTNVVKHAEASQVRVELRLSDLEAIVQVEDNGRGFDAEAALTERGARQNLGLHGMAERAALLGGTFSIRSQPGHGTCLRVEIPVKREDTGNE